MFTFEWDDPKAASNLRKHGVSFDEALSVFGDLMALTFADTDHSDHSDHSDNEDRSRTYGMSNQARLLVIIHTERQNRIRLISARQATRYEKSIYVNG